MEKGYGAHRHLLWYHYTNRVNACHAETADRSFLAGGAKCRRLTIQSLTCLCTDGKHQSRCIVIDLDR